MKEEEKIFNPTRCESHIKLQKLGFEYRGYGSSFNDRIIYEKKSRKLFTDRIIIFRTGYFAVSTNNKDIVFMFDKELLDIMSEYIEYIKARYL